MGNIKSKPNTDNDKTLSSSITSDNIQSVKQLVDDIALHYILTMNFESLTKLYQKDYCDKLVILTSKIIEERLHPLEITYLAKENKNKDETVKTDKMIFIQSDKIDEWNTQTPLEKKEMCNGIAKFYIQIAHIYSAIIRTINPIYLYKNSSGETVEVPFSEKNIIPEGIKPDIKLFNICDQNIDILKRQVNKRYLEENIMNHPTSCELDSSNTLMDEPGIPELRQLYEDDDYDFSDGKFKGMSKKTKEEYNTDLLLFYNAFTGKDKSKLPKNIQSFSDIKLSKYKGNLHCKREESDTDSESDSDTETETTSINEIVLSNKSNMNTLLKEYAENIKNMLQNMNKNRELLLDIINKLFKYYPNPTTGKKEIKINNDLKESELPEIISETRRIIVELYLTCERDYSRGMEIYEAIVDKKILDTAESQIQYFHSLLDEIHG